MDSLGIGIVGGGTAAVDISRALDALPDVRLVAVHDRVERVAIDIAQPRGATVYPTLEAILDDARIDILYIALPHDLLAGTAERALIERKHTLVEKPMALDVATIERLAAMAHDRKLTLGIVFQLRFHGTTRIARRLIRAGAIGRVTNIRVETVIDKPDAYWQSGLAGRTLDDWRAHRARAGGGVVLMNTIHQIDLVRYMTGLSFVRATGFSATLRAGVEVEDAAGAVLGLSNGGIVSIAATAHSAGAREQERIQIDGDCGRIDVPDPDGNEPIAMFLRRPWRSYPAGSWLTVRSPRGDQYAHFLRAYVRAVRTGSRPPATAGDGAAALATVLAIYRSAARGQTVSIEPHAVDGSAGATSG